MSIDLIQHSTNRRHRAFQPARVRAATAGFVNNRVTDIVILFGGWGSEEAGRPFRDEHMGSGTGKLIDGVHALAAASPNEVIVRAYQGALTEGTPAEREVFQLINRHMHPLGKIILHGYSAGGFSAMRLCFRLGASFRYFTMERHRGVVRQRLMPYVHFTPSGNVPPDKLYGFVRVDLLTIVDAAAGPMSSFNLTGPTERRAWPSVRYALNYYQTHPSRVRSHGGPLTATEPELTTVANHDLSKRYGTEEERRRAHGTIDEDAIQPVLARIRRELHRQTP